MDLATSCSMDMIDRSFNLLYFLVDLNIMIQFIIFSLLRSHDAEITGKVKNI